jgi:2-polyprenyl-6-methoxyphenol hydroxylase-like FAD-dependent oxidoreductase
MTDSPVLIAGGGIGGLATALTLHQIGVPCVVFDAVCEMRPLGVGINLQPNAVRELYDLDITERDLDAVGLPAREWALVGLNGNDIYSEPRGLLAGYRWPQYAVHRGRLHMLLFDKLRERIGAHNIRLGSRVAAYRKDAEAGVEIRIEHVDGTTSDRRGALLIGADGIHSAIRAQMHPSQSPIHWGGAIMWRGTTLGKPIRTGASFVGLGTHLQRVVFYPISRPDPVTGLSMINWIAEATTDSEEGWKKRGWFKQVRADDFIDLFRDWVWHWLDVPSLIRQADSIFENPMIDRDPVATWRDGPVALLGDAAHAMYPTGSNGASQAIVDARILGAALIEHGVCEAALDAFDGKLCGPISQLVLRNRGAGPFGLLNMVDERCGGTFDNIDDVIRPEERARFMAAYRTAAGFAIEQLNGAPRTIPLGARVRRTSVGA